MWTGGVWMLFLFLPLQFEALSAYNAADLYLNQDVSCEVSLPYHSICPADLFEKLAKTFREELKIHVSTPISQDTTILDAKACAVEVFVLPKPDRSCLMSSPATGVKSSNIDVPVDMKLSDYQVLVNQINNLCDTYLTIDGRNTVQGMHREYILGNLYNVSKLEQSVTFKEWISDPERKTLPLCDRVEINSREMFFNEYVKKSRPVIITNLLQDWLAMRKWTNQFLCDKYANKSVHVKLSPTSNYEGIERAELWDNYDTFQIPEIVRSKLPYPDLVVPRPAGVSMNFSQFLGLMDDISKKRATNISGYLEYTSIRQYFPELEGDILHPEMAKEMILSNLNLWLSDGNTLGKLHFDPYDNLLCQIDGKKQVTLFDPHSNENLYEAHIPEADYSYNKDTRRFQRSRLLDSTRMVMSPFDIRKPNFKRFPNFAQNKPLNCTISAGEVLFMPSFWWHEVQSFPNEETARNLAVNFWYEPFLTKEFPCPTCRLDVNHKYRHLL